MIKGNDSIIGSNQHYFYYDTEFFFKKMHGNGFKRVELYLGTPHIFIDGKTIDDFSSLKKQADEWKISITDVRPETISFRYHLCSLDNQWNESSLNTYKNAIDYAVLIGAESLNTNVAGAFRDCHQGAVFSRVKENLKILAQYAEKRNILLTIESESDQNQGFIQTLNQMKALDQAIGNTALHFGVNIDAIINVGETINDWKDAFGERIRYLRFSSLDSFLKLQSRMDYAGMKETDKIFSFSEDKYLAKPYKVDTQLKESIFVWD